MPVDFTTVATSAFGFTIALAWNEAVSKALASFFPPRNEKGAARATIAYAVVITLLVVAIVAVIDRTRQAAHKLAGAAGGLARAAGGALSSAALAERFGRPAHGGIVRLWEPPGAR